MAEQLANLSRDTGGWTTLETLKTETYGTLQGCINKSAHLGCLSWSGNGSAPSNQTYTISIPDKYRPKDGYYMGIPMKNASELAVQYQSNTTSAIVRLLTTIWSQGLLIYPID